MNILNKILIYPSELAQGEQRLKGELSQSVFDLKSYDLKPVTDVSFDLRVNQFDQEVLTQGEVSVVFQSDCSRCLKPLEKEYHLEGLAFSMEVDEEDECYDLTEELREEILIRVPQYFSCAQISAEGACEINYPQKSIDNPSSDSVQNSPSSNQDDRWSGLDAWGGSDEGRDNQ